jgi:hypothetical protein
MVWNTKESGLNFRQGKKIVVLSKHLDRLWSPTILLSKVNLGYSGQSVNLLTYLYVEQKHKARK